jgi:hypothetical protein
MRCSGTAGGSAAVADVVLVNIGNPRDNPRGAWPDAAY